MLFQGIPDSPVSTEGFDFYMIFHYIPCYSKTFLRPLRVRRESISIWYSTIFHAIPRHSWDPCGYQGSWFIYDIPRYSIPFQDIPETRAGTEIIIFILYSTIFHAIPRHSWDPCGYQGSRFLYDHPQYSMLFQGIPESLVGTEGVYQFMVFHDIPYYSKAFQRPLRVPRELNFRWHCTIFHAIPRHSIDPCGYRGSWSLYGIPDIPWYSPIFHGIPSWNRRFREQIQITFGNHWFYG